MLSEMAALSQEETTILLDMTPVIYSVSPASQQHSNSSSIPEGCLVLQRSSRGVLPWDNPDNVISQDTERAVDMAVNTVCLSVLFVFSVPANLLNMAVFARQGLTERINLCLFYLSLVDSLHMLNNFVINLDKLLPLRYDSGQDGLGPVMEFIIRHRLVGLDGFHWLSGCVSVLIACERCLCVVSPLRSHTILETRTTGLVLGVASLLILTGSMMRGTRRGLACMYNPFTNTTSTVVLTSKFYARNKTHLDVLTLFLATIQPCLYVIVVFATTTVTAVKLKKMTAWRQETSSSTMTSREVALTRMLIVVSVLYLIFSLPTMVIGLVVVLVPGFSLSLKYYNLSKALVNFAKLGSYINATFNFCVYCSVGSRFRETLCQLFRCTSLVPARPAEK